MTKLRLYPVVFSLITFVLLALLIPSKVKPASAQGPQPQGKIDKLRLSPPKEIKGDLRTRPVIPPISNKRIFPRPRVPNRATKAVPPKLTPVEPEQAIAPNMPSLIVGFNGLEHDANGAGWPPDTVGDVGPNHYIQAVNDAFAIFNKSGTRLTWNTFNGLWQGAGTGTPCDNEHWTDPTVVYDPLGDRWFVADVANGFNVFGKVPPYYECIAVSKTNDPVSGGWWLYYLRTDYFEPGWFADYPKMGIWPDGLYVTANMWNGNTYETVRVWAMNRTEMEAGVSAHGVSVNFGSSNYISMLPSNFRGLPPPSGRENFLITESTTAYEFLIWKFHVDYTGGTSSISGPVHVSQQNYIVAPGTVPSAGNNLETLGDWVMMQAQYRNIGGNESLWVNHTVQIPGSTVVGIQWAQINVSGGTIGTTPVQQQIFGNLGNDGVHRWMGSLAVDQQGNMALGYSGSNSSMYPDIRYAGRLSSDPPNTLAQGESFFYIGTGAQTYSNRWGDYSAMTVDPVDDCTFWFTTEYYATTGSNWQTRIGAFKFPPCGNSPPTTPSNPNPSDGSTVDRTTSITFYWSVSGANQCYVHLWGGPSIDINSGWASCTGWSIGQQWPGSYQWQVSARNNSGTTTGPIWHLYIRPYAPTNLSASAVSSSQINLSWTKSSDDPGSVDSYNVYYSNGTLITALPAGSTSYTVNGLSCGTSYSFYVTAIRQGVESTPSNAASASTQGCSSTVSVISVWTTDGNSATKSIFNPSDSIRYYGDIYNTTGITQTAYFVWSVNGPCGSIASWSGNLSTWAGHAWWYLPGTIPSNACGGTYTYQLGVTYNASSTSQSTLFTVNQTGTRIYLPIILR